MRKFRPIVAELEQRLALAGPEGPQPQVAAQPIPLPPAPIPANSTDRGIFMQSNKSWTQAVDDWLLERELDLLHWTEGTSRPGVSNPSPVSIPGAAPTETWWEYFNRQIGGNNDAVPNPGSLS